MIFFPILRVLKMEWNNNANCSLSLGQHLSSGASLALPPPLSHPLPSRGRKLARNTNDPGRVESSVSPRLPCTRWESILSHPLFVYIRKAHSVCPEGQHFSKHSTLVVNGDFTRSWHGMNIILGMVKHSSWI